MFSFRPRPLCLRRRAPTFIASESRWALEPVWAFCTRQKTLPIPEIEPRFLGHAAHCLVTLSTALFPFIIVLFLSGCWEKVRRMQFFNRWIYSKCSCFRGTPRGSECFYISDKLRYKNSLAYLLVGEIILCSDLCFDIFWTKSQGMHTTLSPI